MITLLLIGIGTGNPDHLTLQAIKALNRADLVLIPCKGGAKADLADLRRDICATHLSSPATRLIEFDLPVRDPATPDYADRVNDWHAAIAATYRDLIARHLGPQGTVALLVWGDPTLYDSTLRIAERLRAIGLPLAVSVIPGLTSLQLLAAAHAIALNTLAAPFLVTTGRRLRDEGIPAEIETVVVMLDGENSFRSLPAAAYDIYWSAYLGLPHELHLSGPLIEIAPQIVTVRASARAEHGWIMDIYLLRRRTG